MRTNPLLLSALLACAGTTPLLSQKDHVFASTGQQKLLVNPSLAASTRGLNIQSAFAFTRNRDAPFHSEYNGAGWSGKKFSFALSNTNYHSVSFFGSSYNSNQTDLSLAYTFGLGTKLRLVPSLQVSYLHNRSDLTKTCFMETFGCFAPIPPQYHGIQTRQGVSFSSGLLLDVNKKITFGLAFYDVNQPDIGITGAQKKNMTQVYHLSLLLLKDKRINLQPYAILKLQRSYDRYYEAGTYTCFGIFSLHTGVRNYFTYNDVQNDISSIHSRQLDIILGASIGYKGISLGYTANVSWANGHEVFLSANLFSKTKARVRNLMLN